MKLIKVKCKDEQMDERAQEKMPHVKKMFDACIPASHKLDLSDVKNNWKLMTAIDVMEKYINNPTINNRDACLNLARVCSQEARKLKTIANPDSVIKYNNDAAYLGAQSLVAGLLCIAEREPGKCRNKMIEAINFSKQAVALALQEFRNNRWK